MIRTLSPLALIATASIVLGSACGGDDSAGDPGGAPITAEAACAAYGAALCGRLEACAGFFLETGFGTLATCEARSQLGCAPLFEAEGVAATPAELDACADAVSAASCEDLLGRAEVSGCSLPKGSLPDGSACGFGPQCQSGYCNSGSDVCGVCAPEAGAGASCTRNEDCGDALVCAADQQCVAPGDAGEGCSVNQPCNPTLACKSGTCGTPGEAGDACTEAGECNVAKGLFCGGNGVCAAIALAGPGEPCGLIGGEAVGCREAGYCKVGPSGGTCLAHADDGEACSAVDGPNCLSPARCISGTCTLVDASSCQ